MRKIGLLLFAISLFILSACGNQREVSGEIVETNIDEEIGIVSFVIKTDKEKDVGIFLTDETSIFSFAEGITADEFKKGSFTNAIVSVEYENLHQSLVTKNNQEINAYNAKEIEIIGFLKSETATLSDGTNVEIWKYYDDTIYILQSGIELLRIRNLSGPNDVYVAGIESFDDLEKQAQLNVVKFYENQGLLYDVKAELEKAYSGYIEEEKSLQFNSYMINQDIAPTASNETMMYFLTSVLLPIDSNHGYAYRIGAGFDKKTGEHINNWDLFSCSPEEAKQKILDIANVNDPILRKEMAIAFKAENIILFPENLEISFKKGTLPSQENSYILGLDYDERLSKILNDWAIPKTSE